MLANLFNINWSSGWTYLMFGGLLLATVLGTWAGAVAAGKGRSSRAWFLAGFFIPIFGVIAVYIVKPRPQEEKQNK